MHRVVGILIAAILAGGGCGDNLSPVGLSHDELLARLRALPGVTAVEGITDPKGPAARAGLSYFVLHFTQPIDHGDPAKGTFQQQVSLLHRRELAPVPMIVHTSGYANDHPDQPVELTQLLDANQVSIEHRYFGTSRPMPTDWSFLTIEQMADDEHAIIAALRTIYSGSFLTTGGSKGGMAAVYHRRFYPDDVEGTVAYVAPISFGAPDPRYPGFFDTVGPDACRSAVRNLAIEMLANRRDQMVARARLQIEHAYTRVRIEPAVEAAIAGLEWAFWQYRGVEHCAAVPAVTASDDELFAFLDDVSPVSECDDEQLAYYEPYLYQTYSQLGYPDYDMSYLAPYLMYTEADYAGKLSVVEPAYDPTAMRDIDGFVGLNGDRLLFVYGQWDPWTAGRFALGLASDSASFIKSQGTHSATITALKQAERNTALAMLERWTGVTPTVVRLRRTESATPAADEAPPRMPPVLVHALAARR